jgi:hypothetical protein
VFEEKLELAEKHRNTLKDFIETMFTDPKKLMQVADLDKRLRLLSNRRKLCELLSVGWSSRCSPWSWPS